MTDYTDIGFNNRLIADSSILLRDEDRIDALRDNSRVVDISETTTERIKDKAVTSAKLADTLALGTVTVDVLTGGTITGTAVFYGDRDLIRYAIMGGDF